MNGHPQDDQPPQRGTSRTPRTNGSHPAAPTSPRQSPPRPRAAAKLQQRTLGPVRNLEEHVHADWWRSLFNALYLKTDADVVDDEAITRREVDLFLDILKPGADDRMLDLCCGQGRHTMAVARRGFKGVEGLDRSRYLISKAKERARREALPIKFREGDARKLPYGADTFEAVLILGNSFGYFETLEDDLRVLREVHRVLKPDGTLLIDVTDGDYLRAHFEARSWEWIDKKHFVCRERSLSEDGRRMISREVITHAEKGVLADQFYAERLYTPEQLSELLQAAGFSAFTTHAVLVSESERNQDLGMMAQRIVATARVRKAWTPTRRKTAGSPALNVAVVMGDPSKPDPMKPLAVFDEDDFETVDTLRQALGSLEGFRFTYLNRHDALVDDLRKLKGKADFVFNLCDEGFGNDPRKELHVPALLELLDLPYTGGNPQCLAHCYDKSLVRGVAKEMGIPVPEACFIQPGDTEFELPFSFPVIVKPNAGDSSFGITRRSVAWNSEELINAISELRERFGYEKPLLIEEFLTGADLTIGIIGNLPDLYTVLPITEEDYASQDLGDLPPICGYEAKWLPDSPYWGLKAVPAQLPPETRQLIQELSLKLFERLECRDYARLDWRLSASGMPKLLEVNPNPGWCWDGHLAKMAAYAELSYAQMLELILRAAAQRLKVGEEVMAAARPV